MTVLEVLAEIPDSPGREELISLLSLPRWPRAWGVPHGHFLTFGLARTRSRDRARAADDGSGGERERRQTAQGRP
jgi:hypothetical protein